MAAQHAVSVYWDMSASVSPQITGFRFVKAIRKLIETLGSAQVFRFYVDFSHPAAPAARLTSELQCSGVTVVDTASHGRPNASTKMMIADCFLQALNFPPPNSYVFISGDPDILYTASLLRSRGHTVVIFCPATSDEFLLAEADWYDSQDPLFECVYDDGPSSPKATLTTQLGSSIPRIETSGPTTTAGGEDSANSNDQQKDLTPDKNPVLQADIPAETGVLQVDSKITTLTSHPGSPVTSKGSSATETTAVSETLRGSGTTPAPSVTGFLALEEAITLDGWPTLAREMEDTVKDTIRKLNAGLPTVTPIVPEPCLENRFEATNKFAESRLKLVCANDDANSPGKETLAETIKSAKALGRNLQTHLSGPADICPTAPCDEQPQTSTITPTPMTCDEQARTTASVGKHDDLPSLPPFLPKRPASAPTEERNTPHDQGSNYGGSDLGQGQGQWEDNVRKLLDSVRSKEAPEHKRRARRQTSSSGSVLLTSNPHIAAPIPLPLPNPLPTYDAPSPAPPRFKVLVDCLRNAPSFKLPRRWMDGELRKVDPDFYANAGLSGADRPLLKFIEDAYANGIIMARTGKDVILNPRFQ